MDNDPFINKAANIQRCVARAREEYNKDPDSFETDFTRQDAAILNIQRACEACLDMGYMLARRYQLGVPQGGRQIFALLAQAGWIPADLAERLQKMVGYRNVAVHDYQTLRFAITLAVIQHHLDDFVQFSQLLLQRILAKPE